MGFLEFRKCKDILVIIKPMLRVLIGVAIVTLVSVFFRLGQLFSFGSTLNSYSNLVESVPVCELLESRGIVLLVSADLFRQSSSNTLPQGDEKVTNSETEVEMFFYSREVDAFDRTRGLKVDGVSYYPEDMKLRDVISKHFLRGQYELALAKLKSIRENSKDFEEREYIDVYIARCYYALNSKRRSIFILLNIRSEKVKPLAEFWLQRYVKYFFGKF